MKIRQSRSIRKLAIVAAVAAGSLVSAAAPSGVASAAATIPGGVTFSPGGSRGFQFYRVSGFSGKTVLVTLAATGGSLSLKLGTTTGLKLSYGYTSFSGTTLSFTGSETDVNKALQSLSLVSGSKKDTKGSIKAMFAEAKDGLVYYPANQHFYRYIPYESGLTGTAKNADVAQTAAKASKEFGVNGYLANITSKAENDFVTSKLEGAKNVWIGGSDAETEGKWVFTDGPDKGKNFWNGCSSTLTSNPGSAPADIFTQWSPDGEPNNYISNTNKCGGTAYDPSAGAGEDCIVTNWAYGDPKYVDGYWNDMPCDISTSSYSFPKVSGYVIEYGDSVDNATFDSTVSIGTTSLWAVTENQAPISKKVAPKVTIGSKIKSAFAKAKAKAIVSIKVKNAQGKTNKIKVKCPTKSKYIMTTTIKLAPTNGKLMVFLFDMNSRTPVDQECGTVIHTTGFNDQGRYRYVSLTPKDEMISMKIYTNSNPQSLRLLMYPYAKRADGSYRFISNGVEPVATGWVKG